MSFKGKQRDPSRHALARRTYRRDVSISTLFSHKVGPLDSLFEGRKFWQMDCFWGGPSPRIHRQLRKKPILSPVFHLSGIITKVAKS